MKCNECIHNTVCSMPRVSNTDNCPDFLPISHFATLEHKLEWLLSYITDGQYSKSSYTTEEMQTIVDDTLDDIINGEIVLAKAEIETYKNDISNLREENTALKDIIVKMVMERMSGNENRSR